MGRTIRAALRRERGAALIEMGFLLILIALAALIAVQFAGGENSELWSEIGSGLTST